MKKIVSFFIVIILILETSFIFYLLSYDRRDVNKDGSIDIKDMLLIQKYILDNSEESDK